MAKVTFNMPDDFIEKLSKLNNKFDEIVPRVLEKGAEPAIKESKSRLALRIGKQTKEASKSTGSLLASLELTKPVQDHKGDWTMRIGVPHSKDSKGISNALKAAVIEYGKSGQPPKPWMKSAKRASKNESIEAMKKALDKEIAKL